MHQAQGKYKYRIRTWYWQILNIKGHRSGAQQSWSGNIVLFQLNLTFSWLNASILFMAVSRAFMDSRKAWSCSHNGLPNKSPEIFTPALDIAGKQTKPVSIYPKNKGMATTAEKMSEQLIFSPSAGLHVIYKQNNYWFKKISSHHLQRWQVLKSAKWF